MYTNFSEALAVPTGTITSMLLPESDPGETMTSLILRLSLGILDSEPFVVMLISYLNICAVSFSNRTGTFTRTIQAARIASTLSCSSPQGSLTKLSAHANQICAASYNTARPLLPAKR